ncbi:bifunctional UDP-N-acetylglucosamine diphosphorylase/glucosamine-1-phosphate N-acetyltransferase GlmU [Helicobacter canis]|uniref:Bifunctional protein GlmU n=1 Tax=Helicobacter canis TaxID=29419 RepID=A0A5M9QPE1_9HELI|nr:bifunctional UDP-N-acetylglucosamine diphosphorylase/glucosamine-1-phosphate N-acetyltransferase GlmU [Helicobacter canis]KAA8709562.1 bifunctional UDP-N-acetylglucosamine diphosphorylase/glucosamine-1-phosphate N-acetyltransferase GlmU [Helicobacter canis]
MAKFSTIILAAGVGSRMKSNKPKVLHRICGKSMIARITEAALQVSDDVHIVLYHQKEVIEAHLREYFGSKLESITLHTQDCQNFPGTGGALMDSSGKLIDLAHDRLVVLNGDMPLITPESIATIAQAQAPIIVSTITLENPSGYGRVLVDSSGQITQIIEEKDCNQAQKAITLVNAGIYGFDRGLLERSLPRLTNDNAQQEYYLTDVIALNAALDSTSLLESSAPNRIKIAPFYGNAREFMGVNSKSELAQAESIRLQELRQRAMDQGVIMRLPESIYLEEWVEFEGECEIENNVRICGKSVIKHSHIKASSVVEDSVIEHSDIGPMAHIRPKSHISHTHIGNFVETKAAHLEGVKAGHLSYLGDCEIGSGSNVGAGVITCNYDGKGKHRTIIGQNVFIGSDTQLVAPVEIESSAIIGAGSTITTNVKSGELALSRTKQSNIAGFFYRFFAKP